MTTQREQEPLEKVLPREHMGSSRDAHFWLEEIFEKEIDESVRHMGLIGKGRNPEISKGHPKHQPK